MRRQEGRLFGAELDRVDRLHARLFKLCTIRCHEVEEEPVPLADGDEAWVEARRDLLTHLVAPAADPWADAGPNRGVP